MSLHHSIHIGAYVMCTYKQAMKNVSQRGCTNPACTQYPTSARSPFPSYLAPLIGGIFGMGMFCPTCGGQIGDVTISVRDRPNCYDVVGDNKLTAIQGDEEDAGDTLYLAAARILPGELGHRRDSDQPIHLALDDFDPVAEVKWFENAFAKELAALRKAYYLKKW
jgi:hypothetical protein